MTHTYKKMVLAFLVLFQCHQDSCQFNIVSILLGIIFKNNIKKLLKTLEFGNMYVCMYVCMYVYMYVCMYVCIYVCMYLWFMKR